MPSTIDSFSQRAVRAFAFLLEDFDFLVEKEDCDWERFNYVPPLSVWFRSPFCRVHVWHDVAQIFTDVAPAMAIERDENWLPLGFVFQWLYPGERYLNVRDEVGFDRDHWTETVDKALAREAEYLRRCESVLRGDFTLRPHA